MRSDPNGYDWRALGYSSLESFIESKAGANPPELYGIPVVLDEAMPLDKIVIRDFPMPEPPPFAADDEDDEAPDE